MADVDEMRKSAKSLGSDVSDSLAQAVDDLRREVRELDRSRSGGSRKRLILLFLVAAVAAVAAVVVVPRLGGGGQNDDEWT
ncbi:hypothetical protein BH20CHL6_BH20CHL6_13520 [soil metagenome]